MTTLKRAQRSVNFTSHQERKEISFDTRVQVFILENLDFLSLFLLLLLSYHHQIMITYQTISFTRPSIDQSFHLFWHIVSLTYRYKLLTFSVIFISSVRFIIHIIHSFIQLYVIDRERKKKVMNELLLLTQLKS